MVDVTTVHLYPARSSELPVIRGNRLNLFKRIIGIEPESEEVKNYEMSTIQFLNASLLYQVNIYHTIYFIDILTANEGLLVFISFVAIQLLVSIPLLVLFLFMSSYSKKGFLTFWDCVPMFRGLGYSMLLCRITYAIFQTYFTITSFLLIVDFLSNPDIRHDVMSCNNGTYKMCIPMYPVDSLNWSCSNPFAKRLANETFYMSTQYHYRFRVINYVRHEVKVATLYYTPVLVALLIWFLVFIISTFGVQRIAKVTLVIQAVFNCYNTAVIIYAMVLSKDPVMPRSIDTNLYKIDFWIDILLHTTDVVVLSDMIYMGTLKPKSLSPVEAGLLVGILKLAYFTLTMFFTQRCTQLILGHYKYADTRCLLIFGHDVLFAFLPDILYRVRFGAAATLIWYISIFYTSVNMLVYTLIGIVNAITEKFMQLYKYRIFVSIGLCIICFLGCIYFCTTLGMNTIYTYRHYGDIYYLTVCFITLNLALMFVYSTKRIVEDYTFTYRGPPKKFWVASWQTAPIIALFTFILMMYQLKEATDETFATLETMLWSYIHCTIILIPIFSQFLAKCFKHVKYRTLSTVTKPSDTWGPHNYIKRQARKYFYPQRDVRYRNNMLTCQHKCIANSGKFYEENRKEAMKMHLLTSQMEKERHSLISSNLLMTGPP